MNRVALVLAALVAGCASADREPTSAPATSERGDEGEIDLGADPYALIGVWTTGEWALYNTAFIDSSEAVFGNHVDTLFRYGWRVENGGVLVLQDPFGAEVQPTVLKLTEDSLVLGGLPLVDEPVRYLRREYVP